MIRILLMFSFFPFFTFAQLNMQQLGYLDLVSIHNSDASDIWGYVDGSGNEYAIVGLNNGTSIVDITNPASPVEVFFESGMNSIWRDIKTWNNHAYVTTEEPQGLLIIDLSTLPGNPNLTTSLYTGPGGNQWESAHNLFIDENGICYIFGANRGNGGAIMLDLSIDPVNPVEVGTVDTWYTHDGVARGDTLYMGHIGDGHMSVWDVSNKTSPVLLGQQITPGSFAHNLWFSDDGNYIYTTDEITNGFLGEFDISDPANIIETDRIQSNPGMNVIPHNTHYINDYIVTSYYRDGVVVHDVSNKGNMVEVGNFDTSPVFSGDGYNGCWGVYPWLPSGNIIASDIENGLYILGINYTRGCYLNGNVTNTVTTGPINGVSVELVSTSVIDQTSIVGNYATGYSTAGTYDVIYSQPAYVSDTIFGVVLANGVTTVQDVQLVPLPFVTLAIVIDELDNPGTPIVGAQVVIENQDFTYSGVTDINGEVSLLNFYAGTYDVYVGKWGFVETCSQGAVFDSLDTTYNTSLETGYADMFNLDLGWQVTGAAPSGIWERAEPVGTYYFGFTSNPEVDAMDCGGKAYVTGNIGGNVNNDDVDNADVILTSPVMNLDFIGGVAVVELNFWWMNYAGAVLANDSLSFIIDDGTNQYTVAEFYSGDAATNWQSLSFNIFDYTFNVSTVQLIVKTADWDSEGWHIVEAGIDNFRVYPVLSDGLNTELSSFTVYPNPSTGDFNISFTQEVPNNLTVKVFDIAGKMVSSSIVQKHNAVIKLETPGIYTILIEGEDYVGVPKKIVKL